jgi:hypothetical protein
MSCNDGIAAQEASQDVLAGLAERVTFENAESGFCVLRVKVNGHLDLVMLVGHLAATSAGQWIIATGEWFNDRTHGLQFKARFSRPRRPPRLGDREVSRLRQDTGDWLSRGEEDGESHFGSRAAARSDKCPNDIAVSMLMITQMIPMLSNYFTNLHII